MVTCSVTLTLVVAGRKASGAPQGPPQRHLPLHRSTARKARKENKEADSNQTWSDANIWFLKCNINMSYRWIQSYNAAHFHFFSIYNIEIYIYMHYMLFIIMFFTEVNRKRTVMKIVKWKTKTHLPRELGWEDCQSWSATTAKMLFSFVICLLNTIFLFDSVDLCNMKYSKFKMVLKTIKWVLKNIKCVYYTNATMRNFEGKSSPTNNKNKKQMYTAESKPLWPNSFGLQHIKLSISINYLFQWNHGHFHHVSPWSINVAVHLNREKILQTSLQLSILSLADFTSYKQTEQKSTVKINKI